MTFILDDKNYTTGSLLPEMPLVVTLMVNRHAR